MNNVSEARWLNELRSEYSIDLAGYYSQPSEYLQNRMDFFLKNPSDSLTEWPNVPLDYGVAVVFGQYLKEQYGPEILMETMGFALAGIQSLDRFFASHNFPERRSEERRVGKGVDLGGRRIIKKNEAPDW